MTGPKKILDHPDLEIELARDRQGKECFIGKSRKYEPYTATAATAIECFFQFDIQLAEQKIISRSMF